MKNNNSNNLVPVRKYENLIDNKPQIFQENKKQSGVYRFINKKNGCAATHI
jgi:hypothetical protein